MNQVDLKLQRIGVLMGGLSGEREVSLRTGRAVLAALEEKGYRVAAIDAGRDLALRLLEAQIDVAFVALHGRYGEDGTVQGLLELMGIPYTGSGVLASSLAMDKRMTKRLLEQAGIPVAEGEVFCAGDDLEDFVARERRYPVVAKPNREGSTLGVTIAQTPEELRTGLEEALAHDAVVLVETYVAGAELTVGVLGGMPLPVIQIVPKSGFYDYTSKYTAGQTEYLLPAPIPALLTRDLQRAAEEACRVLGCRGAARVDFIAGEDGWVCLEVNTIPGMTGTSLLPKAAAEAGIPFGDLCEQLLLDAGLDK